MAACREGRFSYPSAVTATPLIGQQKRGRKSQSSVGRPPKMNKQNRFGVSET
jgi:hypothetical protein